MQALENFSATTLLFGVSTPSITPAKTFIRSTTVLLIFVLLLPLASLAQGNYVYVNNQSAANSIVGYSL